MRTISVVLSLLGLASQVYMETCPEAEDILPCSCQHYVSGKIRASCFNLKSIEDLKKPLHALSGKKNVELDLVNQDLGTVPSNFFRGIGIVKLYIARCKLDRLSEDGQPALLGLENTLEQLLITSTFTEVNVPAKLQLGHMQKLWYLDLKDNTITELGDDWFEKGPVSLKYLWISNNGIEKIGNGAFANLINLKTLYMEGNTFGSIQRSMLPSSAQSLETLHLDNNALTSLPEDIFSNMPSLLYVSLDNNGISVLDERTWLPVWEQLHVIYLEENPIICDKQLDWVFKLRVTSEIYGDCHGPDEVKGKDIQDFIDGKGN